MPVKDINIYPILAIDFGLRRIGLAVSDKNGIIATPLEVLNLSKSYNFGPVFERLVSVIEEHRVKSILIGKPQAFVDSHEIIAEKIDEFAINLKEIIKLPVQFYDESFSTSNAQNMLLSLGQNSKSSRGKIDKISATYFLQEYLDSQNHDSI